MYASFRVQQRKNPSTLASTGKAASWLCSWAEKKRRAMASKSKSRRTCSTSIPMSKWRGKRKKTKPPAGGEVEKENHPPRPPATKESCFLVVEILTLAHRTSH